MAAVSIPVDDTPLAAEDAVPMAAWRRWLIMFILLTGGIKTTLSFTVVVPALQLISEYFKGSGDNILGAQFVVTMAPIGMAISGLFAGFIVAKSSLRKTLYLGLAACSLCGLAPLIVENYYLLLVTRFFLGFSVIFVDIALTTILAAKFTGKERSRIIGFRGGISSIGTVSTMLLSGYLAHKYGWRAPSWMYLTPVVMLVLSLIAFDRPITLAREPRGEERFSVFQLWPIYLLQLATSVIHTMPSFQMPFLLKELGITDPQKVSYVPSLASTFSILAAFAFASVYLRVGRWTLVLACLLMGLGFTGVGLSTTYQMILLCVVVEGIGSGWTMPFFANRLLDRVTPLQRAQAMGWLQSSLFLGHFINPIVTKPIRDNLGIHSTFWAVGGGVAVFAILLGAYIFATRKRDTII